MTVVPDPPVWGGWVIAVVCAALVAQIAWNSRRLRLKRLEDVLPFLPGLGLLLVGAAMAIAAVALIRPVWAGAVTGLFFLGVFLAKFGDFYASFLLLPSAFRIGEHERAPEDGEHGPYVSVVIERPLEPWQAASGACVGVSLAGVGTFAFFEADDIPSMGTRWLVGGLCLLGALGALAFGALAQHSSEPSHARQLALAAEWLRLPRTQSRFAWADIAQIKATAPDRGQHAASPSDQPQPGEGTLEFIGAQGDSLGKLSVSSLPRPEHAAQALAEFHRNAELRAELAQPGSARKIKRLFGFRPFF